MQPSMSASPSVAGRDPLPMLPSSLATRLEKLPMALDPEGSKIQFQALIKASHTDSMCLSTCLNMWCADICTACTVHAPSNTAGKIHIW